MFAKNFFDFTVRGGLIENSGGLGFDYHFFRKKLKVSLEAFNFGNMNLRAAAQFNFYRGVYINAGYNDMMDNNEAASGFLCAGILLTNVDLKLFVSKLPF
jgi:phospholipid/cholesterol/gamma-HCH transport system substrate-binding protein